VSIEFAEEDGTVGGEQKTSKSAKNEGGVEIRWGNLLITIWKFTGWAGSNFFFIYVEKIIWD